MGAVEVGDDDPDAAQILTDLLGEGNAVAAQATSPTSPSPPAPQGPVPATAATQAAPGTTPPAGPQKPAAQSIPTTVNRSVVVNKADAPRANATILDLTADNAFEQNLATLLGKDLELAQHDRSMAIALFQVHLERAEVLDGMAISMPVAAVISDNTGAALKALELAMKAGERVHKAAELLVTAQKNSDAATLAALKIKNAVNEGSWDAGDLPS